jgi:glycosyltransferase involved in cell wall biosynthesis
LHKRILMVAYHYPPIAGSSGYLRTVNFARHLASHGWDPCVLTVHPRAYPAISTEKSADAAPAAVPVIRAFCMDAARHLAIFGRYPAALAWPDRWWSWWLGARASIGAVREFAPDVVWSTYPIATAHWIGRSLSRALGRPWIADFRDPMSGDNYPSQTARRLVARIERLTVRDADRIIVTADGAARSLQATYPEVGAAKYVTISNGYDEAAFRDAEAGLNKVAAGDRIELLHSGLLYPAERDPRPFLNALRRILDDGRIDARRIHVKLRACGYEGEYRPLVRQLALDNVVTFAPAQPYAEALREMLSADGLILFQGSICNGQVPAKLYEYLRTGRPILALTDPAGDTAEVLRRCGIDRIYRMESEEEVTRGLAEFLAAINSRAFVPDDAEVRRYSRTEQAQRLATLLDRVVAASQ